MTKLFSFILLQWVREKNCKKIGVTNANYFCICVRDVTPYVNITSHHDRLQ